MSPVDAIRVAMEADLPNLALLLLQTATSIIPAEPDERLLHPVPSSSCRVSSTEIVVCAQKGDTYRLPASGPLQETTILPKAEWRIFDTGTMGMQGVQRTLPGGISAPAAMVTLTLPF